MTLEYFAFMRFSMILFVCFMSFVIGILVGTLITRRSQNVQPEDKKSDTCQEKHGEV